MTVRTAIMVPIAWALVKSLDLKPRSKGSALIMLTTIEMAVVPGLGLLYGSLDGPVVASVFELKHLPLSYLSYARVLYLPVLVLCALIVFGNQWVLKPERALDASPEFVRNKLRELGSFKRDEMITAFIVLCSIVFWSTDRWHHLPSFFIGMVGLSIFALAGIVGNADIAGGISWTLLLFMGGIFSLQNVLTEYKITDWLAGYFVPVAQHLTFSPVVLLLAVGVATLALRFLDPSGFIAIVVTFVPLVDTTSAAGIPPHDSHRRIADSIRAVLGDVSKHLGRDGRRHHRRPGVQRRRARAAGEYVRRDCPSHGRRVGGLLEVNRSVLMDPSVRIGFVGFGEAAYHIAKGLGNRSGHGFRYQRHRQGPAARSRNRNAIWWKRTGNSLNRATS